MRFCLLLLVFSAIFSSVTNCNSCIAAHEQKLLACQYSLFGCYSQFVVAKRTRQRPTRPGTRRLFELYRCAGFLNRALTMRHQLNHELTGRQSGRRDSNQSRLVSVNFIPFRLLVMRAAAQRPALGTTECSSPEAAASLIYSSIWLHSEYSQ